MGSLSMVWNGKFAGMALLLTLAFSLALGQGPRAAFAGFAPTAGVGQSAGAGLEQARARLEREKVSRTLKSLGYGDDEVSLRMSQLSPGEIGLLAGQLGGSMTPSGGAPGLVVAVVAAVVVVFVIWVLSGYGSAVALSSPNIH
jgi:hypothetical protein